MKQYGDEDFIFLIREEEETNELEHHNNIQDGYIIIDDEKILFKELPVSEDEFTMILPESFKVMPKELVEIKYPSNNRPDFILTNAETTINLTFSHKADKMQEEESEKISEKIRDILKNAIMRMYPASKVIESETFEKDIEKSRHVISYFDFVTPAIDTDIYNLMFFFSLKDRLLMGSFNCLQSDMTDWKEIFIQMLQSVRIIK